MTGTLPIGDKIERVYELSRAVLDARDWQVTLSEPAEEPSRIVFFGDVAAGDNRDASRSGWEGELGIPKDLAVEMLRWLEARAVGELLETLGFRP